MEIPSPEALGSLIKMHREYQKLTQTQLAERAGVSRLWINQIEKGKENASFQLILRTLNALSLSLHASKRYKGESELSLVFEDL